MNAANPSTRSGFSHLNQTFKTEGWNRFSRFIRIGRGFKAVSLKKPSESLEKTKSELVIRSSSTRRSPRAAAAEVYRASPGPRGG